MQLYFIRHGQSTNNQLLFQTGSEDGRSADSELTETGRQQAERLAQFLGWRDPELAHLSYDNRNLAGFGITHLYCSLMVRAVQTGVAVARTLGLPLVAWPEAHEVGGVYRDDPETGEKIGLAGRDRAFFETYYPDLVLPDSLGAEGWWNRPFEEREERPARARLFLDQLRARHGTDGDQVAVISHGEFYNHLLSVLFDIALGRQFSFSMNNTAITRIDWDNSGVNLVYANRAEHLPADLITF